MVFMKRVLIIAYHYPPRPGVASNRIGGLAKYLPDYGWESIILTTPLNEGKWAPYAKVIETNYISISDKIKNIFGMKPGTGLQHQLGIEQPGRNIYFNWCVAKFKEIIDYPDEFKTWIRTAVKEGKRLIKEEKIDAIISSSPPASTHLIASQLTQEQQIPWIADFRDLWTQNHYYYYSSLRLFIERTLECNTLRKASALVTVSEPLVEKLQKIHNESEVYCITNTFDPEEVRVEDHKPKKFFITYTGQIYIKKQDPLILLEVVKELLKNGCIDNQKFELRFYGPHNYMLQKQVEGIGLTQNVFQYGIIKREFALEKQRESSVLLLLNWNDNNESGVYTGKIFEYLAARRNILSIGGPGGVVGSLLKITNTGVHINNKIKLREILMKWYLEFEQYGEIQYSPVEKNVMKYTHQNLARQYAKVLNNYY